jgi:ABC-type antimicrobial peptide transport system permease subunit
MVLNTILIFCTILTFILWALGTVLSLKELYKLIHFNMNNSSIDFVGLIILILHFIACFVPYFNLLILKKLEKFND